MTDKEWTESVSKSIDDFFNNATDEEIKQSLIDANFEYYNSAKFENISLI